MAAIGKKILRLPGKLIMSSGFNVLNEIEKVIGVDAMNKQVVERNHEVMINV